MTMISLENAISALRDMPPTDTLRDAISVLRSLPAVDVPPVLQVLADWENQCGTLAYIAPNEQADLCERLMQAAVTQSPRQAVAALTAAPKGEA